MLFSTGAGILCASFRLSPRVTLLAFALVILMIVVDAAAAAAAGPRSKRKYWGAFVMIASPVVFLSVMFKDVLPTTQWF
jgi:hypothetical protein